MTISTLPCGQSKPALPTPHFPTRWQAFIWRNWGLVPLERLAYVLRTSQQTVWDSALEMGLAEAGRNSADVWLERGFITVIRANWHLLPYAQLLELLDWDEQKLATCLKEDDFLWQKLGCEKPACEPLFWHSLSEEERAETHRLRDVVDRHFPDRDLPALQAPFGFLGTHAHSPVRSGEGSAFDLKLAYSSSAPYGDPLLDSPELLYPDEELAAMKSWGINAVWLQAILYQLHPWPYASEISGGREIRMENLKNLVQRARRHGIAVYLYLNEPRCLSTPLFEEFPHLRGVGFPHDNSTTLCTSMPEVRDYVEKATAQVFREIPGLGGCLVITMSENPTHCWSHNRGKECPRCANRPPEEVMTEVVRCIERGVHAGSASARILVYAWVWQLYEWGLRAVDLLPKGVELLCVSEVGQPIKVGKVDETVCEYSISHAGPGKWAQAMWKQAKKRGLPVHAKIQINTTWECGAVPYIPAVFLIAEHLTRLKKEALDGIMLGWTLGGYLGGNLALLSAPPDEMARTIAGEKYAPLLGEAWRHFSTAFREFPFTIYALYNAPLQTGPANLLYAQPTGWSASMVCFPYDDLEKWRGNYPVNVFEKQFQILADRWHEGIKCLEEIVRSSNGTAIADQLSVAKALACHFQSVVLQVKFIRLRGSCTTKIQDVLEEEIRTAKSLYELMRKDSRIGYEPSNHYFYTVNDLMEKVINCEFLNRKNTAQ
ncbi:MAG: hypothetical protein IAE94_12755 [Chthoniobacterales bacterium]|nr:hypothetical protein [Chthoniobacterales bacterium]